MQQSLLCNWSSFTRTPGFPALCCTRRPFELRESEFKSHFYCMTLSFSGPQCPLCINKAIHSPTSSGS